MKLIKKFFKWLSEILKETIAQTFTLLGFFIAWLTLTGTAKDIVGVAIIASTILWLLTIGLRKDKAENVRKVSRQWYNVYRKEVICPQKKHIKLKL